MLDDLIRGLREFFTSEEMKHMGKHALMHFVKESLPHLWHWAHEHFDDIMDAISNWF